MLKQQRNVTEMLTIDKIRDLLKAWGEWMNSPTSSDYRLGYATSASFTHIGEVITRSVGCAPSSEVSRIHDAMNSLSRYNGAYSMALYYKYQRKFTRKYAAKQMNTTERTYRDWVTQGENFIAGNYF